MTLFDSDDIGTARGQIMAEISALTEEVTDHVSYCTWWTPRGSQVFLQDDTCGGGSMNAEGVFNAKRAGLYQVSVSLQVGVGPGDDLNLWVRHSGENLEETRVHGVSDQMNFG